MPRIGASTMCLSPILSEDTMSFLRSNKFDLIEINMNYFPLTWDRKKHSRIVSMCRSNGLMISIHSPNAVLDPANQNEDIAEASLSLMIQVAKLANLMQAPIIVHATSYSGSIEENVEPLCEIRRACRTKMYFENSGEGIGASEDDIEHVIDEVGVPLNLDIGHLWRAMNQGIVSCSIDDFFSVFSDEIGYAHIHDNYGKEDLHLGLGRGNIPFEKILPHLREVDALAWVIEVREGKDLLPSAEIIRRFAHEE